MKNGEPQQAQPKFIQCPRCNQPTTVVDPQGFIINQLGFSQILSMHEQPQRCEQCGQYLAAAMEKVAIGWKYIAVEAPQEKSLIMSAPAGMKI